VTLLSLGGQALLAALPINSLSASEIPATDRSRADGAQLVTADTAIGRSGGSSFSVLDPRPRDREHPVHGPRRESRELG
jgi:hypothetical protein